MNGYTFERRELKYRITDAQRAALEAAFDARMVPDEHGESTICNIYYDTADYRLIRASLEKPAYKEKLRLRSYGATEPGGEVFLELKKKYRGIVYKRRITLPEDAAGEFIAGRAPLCEHTPQGANSRSGKPLRFFWTLLSPAPAAAQRRGAWQTFVETQPDALYAGLVGTLTSAVMNLPGEAYALARKNKPGAVPDAQQSGNSVPRLFTRDEVQGMSAREVSENYDAIRESMEMWDENGELQGGTQSRMVDRQAPGEDNETTSGNERLYTRAEVQGMSEEEQLANVDAIRESMGLWDAEGKLSKESEITIEEVRDDFEQIKHIKNLENFVEDPLLLKDVSPETLYCFLEKQGYTILPLAQSKTLTGIHYKDGGGFKVNWGGDRILQYHPATGSHHNGAYYKISSGKTGKVRIDLHGNKI